MSANEGAEGARAYRRIEYGVIVDRTSKGLGYFLANTYSDLERAQILAAASPDHYGHPAEVKQRLVVTTDWQPLTTPGAPS